MPKAQRQEWWTDRPREIYWCEITGREDIGADLKCPQTDASGRPQWSYALIRQVLPGDIIFHYSTRDRAFVGASAAGAPLQERDIVWTPHSVVVLKTEMAAPRPGWWLPLHRFIRLVSPFTLDRFRQAENQAWIRQWAEKGGSETDQPLRLPFQLYPGEIRGAQGYLTKMPSDFVSHWPEFASVVERLGTTVESLTSSVDFNNPEFSARNTGLRFSPKDDSDYVAFIKGGAQQRSRAHETLVKRVGEFLINTGAVVLTPHPIDLLMTKPCEVIFEMKIVDNRSPGLLIREAVGQLLEYHYFLGPREAFLCIVLECNPGPPLISYVEDHLKLGIAWFTSNEMHFGPRTAKHVPLGTKMSTATI